MKYVINPHTISKIKNNKVSHCFSFRENRKSLGFSRDGYPSYGYYLFGKLLESVFCSPSIAEIKLGFAEQK
jgi:hypothetical protein